MPARAARPLLFSWSRADLARDLVEEIEVFQGARIEEGAGEPEANQLGVEHSPARQKDVGQEGPVRFFHLPIVLAGARIPA